MAYKSQAIDILETDTEVFVMPATFEGVAVIGVGNNTAGSINLTLKIYKGADATTTTLFTSRAIEANKLVKIEVPFFMEPDDKIICFASAVGLCAFAGVPQSQATPVKTGWNHRGTYSAIATYNINDVVDASDGGSYASRQDGNIGHDPANEGNPAYWGVNSKRGPAGAGGDFVGPAASVDGNVMLFDGTTGKLGKDSGYGIGASGAAIGILNANNTIGGANTYDKTQTPNEGALTTAVAADFSTKQRWKATVNGASFTIANPTSPVGGTIYDVAIDYTTSHGVTFGNKFKIGDFLPSATAGQKDRISFEYDATDDLFYRRGISNNIGA